MFSAPSIRLVIIGHVGFAEDHTVSGSSTGLGGSAYACAMGASVIKPRGVGVVARVGDDFPASSVEVLGVNTEGLSYAAGRAPRLKIIQYAESRSFSSELGVANDVVTGSFPDSYARASHIHLATMPLVQQMRWLRYCRQNAPAATMSADMFEATAESDPELSRSLCSLVDIAFLNECELKILYPDDVDRPPRYVGKRGAGGASYFADRQELSVSAPSVDVVDTTGAGELLAGVFLSMLTAGHDAHHALDVAVLVASTKVQEFGLDGAKLRQVLASVQIQATRQAGHEGLT